MNTESPKIESYPSAHTPSGWASIPRAAQLREVKEQILWQRIRRGKLALVMHDGVKGVLIADVAPARKRTSPLTQSTQPNEAAISTVSSSTAAPTALANRSEGAQANVPVSSPHLGEAATAPASSLKEPSSATTEPLSSSSSSALPAEFPAAQPAAATGTQPSRPPTSSELGGDGMPSDSNLKVSATEPGAGAPFQDAVKERSVSMAKVVFDRETQIRCEISVPTVQEYAENMRRGIKYPPAVLFEDGVGHFFIGDGWHRLKAASECDYQEFPAIVSQGGKEAAILYALRANDTHGLPRTNEDKKRAVALACVRWPELSNRQLADRCAVSEGMVRAFRQSSAQAALADYHIGADGKRYRASAASKKRARNRNRLLVRQARKLLRRMELGDLQRIFREFKHRLNGCVNLAPAPGSNGTHP